MNVSKQSDYAFMEALKAEAPARFDRLLKHIRRDSPSAAMGETQAITNFVLGLPTAGFKFAVYERPPILNEALDRGTTDEYVNAILSVASSDGEPLVVRESQSVPIERPGVRRGGRPRLQLSKAERASRLRKQWRESKGRKRHRQIAVQFS